MRPLLKVLLFFAVVLYLTAADITYRFRHPEQTETQRFLHVWDALRAAISRHRFALIVLPITLVVTYLVILLTNAMTGRESTDDAGAVVGYCYAVIKCIFAITLTVLVKTHVDISRPAEIDGTKTVTSVTELFISRASTIALIWLFLHAIEPK